MPLDLDQRGQERLGTVLHGKYRLDRVLGSGGMAVVYAATHRNQKRLAIKMLHPELAMRAEIRSRFLREGYAANTVDHPGAVAVLDDVTSDEGDAYLVMELLEGKSVERLWEENGRRLPVRAVLAIAYQLLDVLAAAHAKAIIHRDIKPENLFVTKDGTLKVLDFGIARVREAANMGHATTTGAMLGTPLFMAPEQAAGRASQIDERTDLWSVGASMFTLLSGQTVHDGETAQHVVLLAATQPARGLALADPEADPRVAGIVDRALALDKAQRWPSAMAMREAVGEAHLALFGEPIVAASLVSLLGSLESGSGAVAAVRSGSVISQVMRNSAGMTPAQPTDGSNEAPQLPTPRHRARPGMTTEEPVSSGSVGPNKRRMGPLAGAAIALAAVVIGGALLLRSRSVPDPAAAGLVGSQSAEGATSPPAVPAGMPEGLATVEPAPPSTSTETPEPAASQPTPSHHRRQGDAGPVDPRRQRPGDWDTP